MFCLSLPEVWETLASWPVCCSVKQRVGSEASSLLLGLWLLLLQVAHSQISVPGGKSLPREGLGAPDLALAVSEMYRSTQGIWLSLLHFSYLLASECSGVCWDLEPELTDIKAFTWLSRGIYTTASPMLPAWILLGLHKD